MEAKEILGLDLGAERTGIARASNVARLAEPLMSVPTKDAISTIRKYTSEHKVEAIAIGLPRNLSGEETKQTQWVREWTDKAKQKLAIPAYWQDEATTSLLAEAKIQNSKFKIQNVDEHSLAAAILLQDFLDGAEADRMAV
ncbi:Holliday junction resolvase RuvX [Candidatus Saccharibacteria bacterium]|nr:Holliday junction resolvase RuvX [Candidatus Saccharibacteria bacterium]